MRPLNLNKRQRKTNVINAILRTLGLFDLNGLKYSIQHLNAIRKDIGSWELESQAAYVDLKTKQNVDSHDPWYEVEIHMKLQEMTVADLHEKNATVIGNIAYVCLFAKTRTLKTTAENLLSDYRRWLQVEGLSGSPRQFIQQ